MSRQHRLHPIWLTLPSRRQGPMTPRKRQTRPQTPRARHPNPRNRCVRHLKPPNRWLRQSHPPNRQTPRRRLRRILLGRHPPLNQRTDRLLLPRPHTHPRAPRRSLAAHRRRCCSTPAAPSSASRTSPRSSGDCWSPSTSGPSDGGPPVRRPTLSQSRRNSRPVSLPRYCRPRLGLSQLILS